METSLSFANKNFKQVFQETLKKFKLSFFFYFKLAWMFGLGMSKVKYSHNKVI